MTTTTTLNLTTASPAELRAECERLGLTYRTKDDRKALTRKIVAAQNAAPSGPSKEVVEAACAALQAEMETPEFAAALNAPVPPAAERVERMKLAKDEAKTMKAWRKSGAKGTPPETPNLDALNAESSSTPRKATGAKSTAKSTTKSSTRTPKATTSRDEQYRLANAEMKQQRAARVRRTGRKLGDSDVRDHVRGVLREHADATCGGELLVARWLCGMSMDRYRWNALWAEIVAERAAQ